MDIEEKVEQFLKVKRKIRPVTINLESCALIIIDMQNYQVKEKSPVVELVDKLVPDMLQYLVKRVEEVVNPNISHLLKFFRSHQLAVFYTKFASRRMDGKDYPPNIRANNEISSNLIGKMVFPHMQDPLTDIIPEIKPEKTDTILLKISSGAFSSTDLEHQLRNLDINTIIVVGVLTHACVESTVRIGSDLGFNIIVVEDACAGWTPSLHNAALKSMEIFYADILTTNKTLKILEKQIMVIEKKS